MYVWLPCGPHKMPSQAVVWPPLAYTIRIQANLLSPQQNNLHDQILKHRDSVLHLAMKGTSLADGESISNIFWTQ